MTNVNESMRDAWAAEQAQRGSPLNPPPPGGTLPPMDGDWKNGVDTQLTQLHQDVRNLLYGVIGSFVILAGGGWVVYDKLAERSTALQIEVAKQGEQLSAAREKLQDADKKLDGIEAKLDRALETKK